MKGANNYHNWCFAIKNVLAYKSLEGCIEPSPNTETDATKLKNCKAILSLSVEPDLYVHIVNCDSALKIWKLFKDLYDAKGIHRKITLLRGLISTKLEDFHSMQEYLNQIKDYSNKLANIEFTIDDDWKCSIMLAGLTQDLIHF